MSDERDSYRELLGKIVEVYRAGMRDVSEEGRLSEDLTAELGGGFSPRHVACLRQFYVEYEILHTCAKLSWSHYKVLMGVKDLEERARWERRALEGMLPPGEKVRMLTYDRDIYGRYVGDVLVGERFFNGEKIEKLEIKLLGVAGPEGQNPRTPIEPWRRYPARENPEGVASKLRDTLR